MLRRLTPRDRRDMRKIVSVFQRNYDGDRLVRDEVVPGSEWVLAGEGVATRKWDGIAIRVLGGRLYKRYDAKAGRTPPADFEPVQPAPDPNTGHWPGWVPADEKRDWLLFEGVAWGREKLFDGTLPDGTYEVCGPRVGTRHGANPEALVETILVPHGRDVLADVPRDFEGMRRYLELNDMEGIVFWHPDGRMAKIKRFDFGLSRAER
jgi:hypothetical protein